MPEAGLAARYITGTGTVGGDWYDVFVLPDGRLGVVVGDVAGSGLGAADQLARDIPVELPGDGSDYPGKGGRPIDSD